MAFKKNKSYNKKGKGDVFIGSGNADFSFEQAPPPSEAARKLRAAQDAKLEAADRAWENSGAACLKAGGHYDTALRHFCWPAGQEWRDKITANLPSGYPDGLYRDFR